MSTAVAVAAADGIAVATDSRTTQLRADESAHYRVASDTAEKLFVVDGQLLLATYGVATIDGASIRGLLEQMHGAPAVSAAEYADVLGAHFQSALTAATPARRGGKVRSTDLTWPLGFVVAGFGRDSLATVLDVRVRPTSFRVTDPGIHSGEPGVISRGQDEGIQRLLCGVDWPALQKAGVKLKSEDQEKVEELHYDLIDAATVDDAGEFARFLVEVQIGIQAYSDGTLARPRQIPGAGGVPRVAVLTSTGADWVANASRPLVSQPRRERELGRVREAP